MMFVNQSDYIAASDKAGVLVSIHDHNQSFLDGVHNLESASGMLTLLAINEQVSSVFLIENFKEQE